MVEIPCNTAHKRLEEFAGSMFDSVIDIRGAVLSDNKNATGFILLGTNPTTGVGLPEGEVGIYEKYRRIYFPEERPFVVPNEVQQAEIMSAIADVKAGEFKEAKAKIMRVIESIRALPGCNLPVILGCTELPLVFTTLELGKDGLLDPANSLKKIAQKELARKLVEAAAKEAAKEVARADAALGLLSSSGIPLEPSSSLSRMTQKAFTVTDATRAEGVVGTSPSIKGGSGGSASRLSSGSVVSSDGATTPTAQVSRTGGSR